MSTSAAGLPTSNQMQHVLRTSERSEFAICPQRWWWRWRDGLVPKGLPAQALWFGTGVHIALAAWYCGPGKKRGPHPAETFAKFAGAELDYVKTKFDSADEERIEKYVEASELGRIMLNGYVDRYGRDEHMDIIQPEHTFALDIPWPDGRQAVYEYVEGLLLTRYVGTYDLVWRDLADGKIRLEEHKTASTIDLHHLPMDNQAGSYWAVATRTLRKMGSIGEKDSLAGIEYNFLRKGLPDDRPRDAQGYACNKPIKADYIKVIQADPYNGRTTAELNKMKLEQLEGLADRPVLGERSKVQPSPLFVRHMVYRTRAEQATQLRRIQDEAVHMRALRDGYLPLTLAPSRDHCRFCNYKAMCELKERGGNWQDFKALQYNVEDPYADHRKSTGD